MKRVPNKLLGGLFCIWVTSDNNLSKLLWKEGFSYSLSIYEQVTPCMNIAISANSIIYYDWFVYTCPDAPKTHTDL